VEPGGPSQIGPAARIREHVLDMASGRSRQVGRAPAVLVDDRDRLCPFGEASEAAGDDSEKVVVEVVELVLRSGVACIAPAVGEPVDAFGWAADPEHHPGVTDVADPALGDDEFMSTRGGRTTRSALVITGPGDDCQATCATGSTVARSDWVSAISQASVRARRIRHLAGLVSLEYASCGFAPWSGCGSGHGGVSRLVMANAFSMATWRCSSSVIDRACPVATRSSNAFPHAVSCDQWAGSQLSCWR
jgi:hypothetical protein